MSKGKKLLILLLIIALTGGIHVRIPIHIPIAGATTPTIIIFTLFITFGTFILYGYIVYIIYRIVITIIERMDDEDRHDP